MGGASLEESPKPSINAVARVEYPGHIFKAVWDLPLLKSSKTLDPSSRSPMWYSEPMPNKLSRQERKLLGAAAEGETDKETARNMHVTTGTIRTYWERIKAKLATLNKTHSVAKDLKAEHAEELKERDAKIAELKAEIKERR